VSSGDLASLPASKARQPSHVGTPPGRPVLDANVINRGPAIKSPVPPEHDPHVYSLAAAIRAALTREELEQP
jgi:hypothetical protein